MSSRIWFIFAPIVASPGVRRAPRETGPRQHSPQRPCEFCERHLMSPSAWNHDDVNTTGRKLLELSEGLAHPSTQPVTTHCGPHSPRDRNSQPAHGESGLANIDGNKIIGVPCALTIRKAELLRRGQPLYSHLSQGGSAFAEGSLGHQPSGPVPRGRPAIGL